MKNDITFDEEININEKIALIRKSGNYRIYSNSGEPTNNYIYIWIVEEDQPTTIVLEGIHIQNGNTGIIINNPNLTKILLSGNNILSGGSTGILQNSKGGLTIDRYGPEGEHEPVARLQIKAEISGIYVYRILNDSTAQSRYGDIRIEGGEVSISITDFGRTFGIGIGYLIINDGQPITASFTSGNIYITGGKVEISANGGYSGAGIGIGQWIVSMSSEVPYIPIQIGISGGIIDISILSRGVGIGNVGNYSAVTQGEAKITNCNLHVESRKNFPALAINSLSFSSCELTAISAGGEVIKLGEEDIKSDDRALINLELPTAPFAEEACRLFLGSDLNKAPSKEYELFQGAKVFSCAVSEINTPYYAAFSSAKGTDLLINKKGETVMPMTNLLITKCEAAHANTLEVEAEYQWQAGNDMK